MFSFFKKILGGISRLNTPNQPLRLDELGEFLYTLRLRHVSNVLDADALWEESSYAGQETIRTALYDVDQQTEYTSEDYRLYRALQDHPRIVAIKDENNISDQAEHIFTDIIIWIPKVHWDNDARQGGHKIYIMADRLAHAHQRDLGKDRRGEPQLLNGRRPRYCIMPEPNLARDEVICQFGLGVFIPDANDARHQLAEFNLRKDEQGFAFTDWIFFEQGRRITRPIGWYAGQHFLHIAQDPSYRYSCIQAPTWFTHGKGYIQLTLNSHAETAQAQQMYADEQYVHAGQAPYDGFGDRIVCEYHNAQSEQKESLSLEIIPDQAIVDQTESGSSAANRLMEMTLVGGAHASRHQLDIVGFVLPRLDGQYLENGIQSWQITLDSYGRVIEPFEYTQTEWIRFLAYTDREGLYFQNATMSQAEPFAQANEVFCGNYCYHILPAVSPDDQYALISATSLASFNLETSAQVLGRTNSDLPINLLDKEGTLLRTDGSDFGRTLQHVGFSSQHAGIHLQADTLSLRQLSKSSPIYILDDARILKDKIAPAENKELKLIPNEGFIVGNYVFKFQ